MQDQIEIKLATKDDIEFFYPFLEKSITSQFSEYSPRTTQYFLKNDYPKGKLAKSIQNETNYLFIASKNNKIYGYLIGNRTYGGVALLVWLAVEEKSHNLGIGKSLISSWEEFIKQKGGHKIHLWTAEKNIEFYRKRGYILVGKIPENYFGSEDFFMYKTLQKAKEENYL